MKKLLLVALVIISINAQATDEQDHDDCLQALHDMSYVYAYESSCGGFHGTDQRLAMWKMQQCPKYVSLDQLRSSMGYALDQIQQMKYEAGGKFSHFCEKDILISERDKTTFDFIEVMNRIQSRAMSNHDK